MNMITDLVRMWLTRSVKPFVFTGEFDSRLPYEECEQLGLYVHIPFCRSVCNFCPYCKMEYSKERCDRYIDALIQEIHLVGGRGEEKKRVTSLYFGGGTPALAAGRLKEIIDALGRYYDITEGIGVELHPSDVVLPVLRTLRDAGVTKLSIGIQSFQGRHQAVLGREAADPAALAARREELEEELARRRLEAEALSAAMDALTQANARLQERFSPELNRLAGAYMARLTGERYSAVSLTRELEGFVRAGGDVLPRSALYLSRGTADQLYLAVRLAVCRLCLPEKPPILLDDALTAFDDLRLEPALELLWELSREQQILLFTCQKREGEALAGVPGVTRIAL